MKQHIAVCAARLFDQMGYHGTSMRSIGDAVPCTMPTVYYYYQSKEALFDQVAYQAFVDMIKRLDEELPHDVSPMDTAIARIQQKLTLNEQDRLTYRLAIKTWMGFEGCEETRQKLLQWEQARYRQNEAAFSTLIASPHWVRFATRSVTHLIQRIVLFGERPSPAEIREELTMIFEVASRASLPDAQVAR